MQRGAVYSSHMLRYSTEKSIKWRNPVSPTIRCKSAAARVKIKFILKINGAVTESLYEFLFLCVDNSFSEVSCASYGNINLSLLRSYLAVIVQTLNGSLQEFDVSHHVVISENNKTVAASEQDKRKLREDVE